MKRISFFLLGINFFIAVIASLFIGHYFTYANLFIVMIMMFVVNKKKEKIDQLINLIWNGLFVVYNSIAIIQFFCNEINIYEDKFSFVWQYVLFVIVAYLTKLVYNNMHKENN